MACALFAYIGVIILPKLLIYCPSYPLLSNYCRRQHLHIQRDVRWVYTEHDADGYRGQTLFVLLDGYAPYWNWLPEHFDKFLRLKQQFKIEYIYNEPNYEHTTMG